MFRCQCPCGCKNLTTKKWCDECTKDANKQYMIGQAEAEEARLKKL